MSNIIQYVVVRGDLIKALNWPLGAVIAQCCHASTAVSHIYRDDEDTKTYFSDIDNMHKCILEATDEKSIQNLSTVLEENGIKHKLWIEQPENIPTCLAVKPYQKEIVQKYMKKFKLFK